jgi:hypothetical protein
MNVSCEILIDFDDAKQAKTVLKSIEIDNFDFVKSKTSGGTLKAQIESNSVSSFIHTLDDFLACVSVAAKVVDKN